MGLLESLKTCWDDIMTSRIDEILESWNNTEKIIEEIDFIITWNDYCSIALR